MAETTKCAGALIELKDSIHRIWFDLQSYPSSIKLGDTRLLQKDLADEILARANDAVRTAEDCEAPSGMEPRWEGLRESLSNTIKRIAAKLQSSQVQNFSGANYYAMDQEQATSLIINDINNMANYVHRLGYSFIKNDSKYCGCRLDSGDDLAAVNKGALAYCEGVPGYAYLRQGGTKVEHSLGAHKNVITFTEDEDGYEVGLEYIESGANVWEDRRDGVLKVLTDDYDMECESGEGQVSKCAGQIRDLDKIREIAYFMSGIHDVDLLLGQCVPDAIKLAHTSAQEVVEELGAEAYTRYPYPYDMKDWANEVCPDLKGTLRDEEREEEEEEDDSERLVKELWSNAKWYISKIKSNLKTKPLCTWQGFARVKETIITLENNLKGICRELHEGGFYHANDDCEGAYDELEPALKSYISEFLQDCPPESVIAYVSALYSGYDLEPILNTVSDVCAYMDRDDCVQKAEQAWKLDRERRKQLLLL